MFADISTRILCVGKIDCEACKRLLVDTHKPVAKSESFVFYFIIFLLKLLTVPIAMRIQVVKIVVREKGTVITLLMRLKPNKTMQCVELLKQSVPAKF